MKVVFSQRAFSGVLAETAEKVKTETGGLFLGAVRDGTWYIVEAIDPGPKSIFEVAYFEYDQQYTQHLINKIANLYEQKLELIGLWHRHPGSFDVFSSTDDGTNAKYASMRPEGAISGLVNLDPGFRFTMYHVEYPARYRRIPYEVGDELIPPELLRYRSRESYFQLMERRLRAPERAASRVTPIYKSVVSLGSFMRFILPELQDRTVETVETEDLSDDSSIADTITEAIIDDVTFMSDVIGVEFTMSLQGQYLTLVQEAVSGTVKLYFAYMLKDGGVIFSYEDKCYSYTAGEFQRAYRSAMDKKDRSQERIVARRKPAPFSSMRKIIKSGKKVEENDGDKDT